MIASSGEGNMDRIPDRLFYGTLETLLLQSLVEGPRHGYDIASWLEAKSASALNIEDAALYTALHRMEAHGWIAAEWGMSPKRKRAKFYRLTASGRRQLVSRAREWTTYVATVDRILRPTLLALKST
jgi:PadR family transcriptional regulator, regulatory protein PadR